MIQRIQTLYLTIVVISGTLLCFFAPVDFISPENAENYRELSMTFTGVYDITNRAMPVRLMNTVSLSIISVVIPLIALVNIFLFKRRILQARINVVNVVLCLGWYAIYAVYIWFAKENFFVEWYMTPWAAIPLVNLVLTLMATRAILKDEALVRAADRLR
ncbi:MAG: DUF4293 domain-containing protein [Paludibacteraceae bacterium]|nr:DUF4293 domain-containing protein [Paludibacteraceae bacterium]